MERCWYCVFYEYVYEGKVMAEYNKDKQSQTFNPVRVGVMGAEYIGERVLILDLQKEILLGLIASVFVFLSTFAVGQLSDFKAQSLLSPILPTPSS